MASYNKSFNFRNGVQVDDDNFIVNANGLVGIGTSIPREFLDVYGTAKVTGLVTTTNLYVSGIATFNQVRIGTGITISSSSGIITANYYYGDGSHLTNLPTSQWIDVDPGVGYTSIYTAGNVGVGTTNPSYTFQVGGNPVTSNGVGFNSTGNVYMSGILTARTANITDTTTLNNLIATASTTTSLQVSGTGTIGTLNATTGIVTTLSGTNLTYSGTGNINTLNATTGIVTTLSGTTLTYGIAGITTLTTTTGTITNLTNTNLTSTASTITYLTNTNLRTTGIATIQTLKTVDGNISYLTGESISVNGNIRSDTLNVNSGIVTTISGTNLTYSGTGSINTLNAVSGVVTTISGTTLTYATAGITTLTTTTGTITNLSSTNITAFGGFVGNLTGIAASATQLVTPRNFSITGSFVTAPAISFDGTANVALAATITPNSIGLGTHTNGNYVQTITGIENQIIAYASPSPGNIPAIGLTTSVSIVNDLYVGRNIGIGTTIPAYNLDITIGDGSRVGISTLGNITATGIISTTTLKVGSEVVIQSGIITTTTLKVGTGVTIQSGIITATRLSIGTAGTTITTNNNRVGIGTTNPQGILDLVSTTSAFYLPRMTTAQRDAMVGISSGAMIYNTSVNEFQGFKGSTSSWITVGA